MDDEEEKAEVTEGFWVETRDVPADDMPWTTPSGKEYFPQVGRHVTYLDAQGVGLTLLLSEFSKLQRKLDRAGPDMNSMQQMVVLEAVHDALMRSVKALNAFIAGWDLVGWRGEPLPTPEEDPEVILVMPMDAIGWLFAHAQFTEQPAGTDEVSRKKGSRPSGSRSRAKPRQPSGSNSRSRANATR